MILRIGLFLLALLSCHSAWALRLPFQPENPPVQFEVLEPYIDLHAGPAKGYPVFYVAERGETLELLSAHTEWYRVKTERGKIGWVHWDGLEQSLEQVAGDDQFIDNLKRDYDSNRFSLGFYGGSLSGAPLIGARAGYRFNPIFSVELDWAEVADDFSSSDTWHANLLWHPIHYWALNPYLVMGVGKFSNDPDPNLTNAQESEGESTLIGIGTYYQIDHRIYWHLAYKNHFVYLDGEQQNSFQEWSTGINYQIGSLANHSIRRLYGYGLDTNNIEVGLYTGSYSIEDFTANTTSGQYFAYHVSESFFIEASRAHTSISDRSYRELGLPVLNQTGGGSSADLNYLNLAIGYKAFPGEVVILDGLSNWKLHLYFTFGVGRTEFQRRDLFTWMVGTGFKIQPGKRWAAHFGFRDHMYEFDILGENKEITHNLETLFAISFNF